MDDLDSQAFWGLNCSTGYVCPGKCHMPNDAKRCRERAKECWAWAASTNNPSLKESLADLAKRWTRLATQIETTRILFEEAGRVFKATREDGPMSMTGQARAKLSPAGRAQSSNGVRGQNDYTLGQASSPRINSH